ncbi:MAG: 2-isopropylmalate synthase [Oscillospiraceae bacterium]|nr:2-isopropylmalate synthase [Oscillospiraceae bacterium]
MRKGFEKYRPFEPVSLPDRTWPSRTLRTAPVWCSIDLRDGNQALLSPMNVLEKTRFFEMLTSIGFREIEAGFPSASDTEFQFIRKLIEEDLVPEGVSLQVLSAARPNLIKRSYESIAGARRAIMHICNPTSELQRRVVFRKDAEGVARIAEEAAKAVREYGEEAQAAGTSMTYEYSPESFTATELDCALMVCDRVMRQLDATKERKVIINLPATVENCMPNQFADLVEAFCRRLEGREAAIISVHPHNDRGTAVAAAELALLAGAQRVEGTMFGNGERTGNVDIVTLAMNLWSQAVDPGLDMHNIGQLRQIYEDTTGMAVGPRHPYSGDLVFTSLSGSHQDAISKGLAHMKDDRPKYWEVPYLPIDPADVGRQYEPLIRISSQSGKGGAAYIMQVHYGYDLPRDMRPEFGALVTAACDRDGGELSPDEVYEIFQREYVDTHKYFELESYRFEERTNRSSGSAVCFTGVVRCGGEHAEVSGWGNGPIDAFFVAVRDLDIGAFTFESYSEHAISTGSDSKAVAYIKLRAPSGKDVFGVGISHNINVAPLKGVLSAVNRAKKQGLI